MNALGVTGWEILALLGPVGLLVVAAVAVYWIVRRAAAAGVRDAHAEAASAEQSGDGAGEGR